MCLLLYILPYFDFYFSYLFETNSQHELFSHKKAIKYKSKLIPNGSDLTFGRLSIGYAQTTIHFPIVYNYAHIYSNIQPYHSDQALTLQNMGRKQATQDTDLYGDFH